ncbi:hypothetical protein LUZ62_025968 [Rhynchospora pubera]|uniref:RNase H type-1 domain-containing protein n=1 Tax=Rhynchospora pubera TaxID=906938 RepID=A0AAV8HBW3_9POAL|nr:hypothetical protein LUZ62_025968 [Rhynchospora pubera]
MHDAIPVRAVFARRLRLTPPPCDLCGLEHDDAMHVLFDCDVERNYWFSSHLALRADALPKQVIPLLQLLLQQLGREGFMVFANLLWSLWKARCKQIYEGVKINIRQVLAMAVSLDRLGTVAGNQRCIVRGDLSYVATELNFSGRICTLDGSFKEDGSAGWAHMLYEEGVLVAYGMWSGEAASPFHVEALAFQAAVRQVQKQGWTNVTFYTDSQILARILNGMLSPDLIDWKAYGLIIDLIAIWKDTREFQCFATPRDNLHTEHRLANLARVDGLTAEGFTFPLFPFVT